MNLVFSNIKVYHPVYLNTFVLRKHIPLNYTSKGPKLYFLQMKCQLEALTLGCW